MCRFVWIVAVVVAMGGPARAGYIEVLDGSIRPPEGDDFVDVSVGMALRADGSVFCWYKPPPPGNNFVALDDGGTYAIDSEGYAWARSSFTLMWGHRPDPYRDIDSSGQDFTIGLWPDGTVAAWGSNEFGQLNDVPTTADFVDIAAGGGFSVGLREDGSLVAWGSTADGVRDVPEGNDFTAVSAATGRGLALREDGSMAAWGVFSRWNVDGRAPEGNDYVAITAGGYWNWAIREDGSLARWKPGADWLWEIREPPAGYRYIDVAGGGVTSVALVEPVPEPSTWVGMLIATGFMGIWRWCRRAAA